MTKLSINLNKVALLRNARTIGIPSVLKAAEQCIRAGAHGITVHPRPDERHIRVSDVYELRSLLQDHPAVEFNIEGNPFPEFMELLRQIRPEQATLVPDSPDALTSDHGWDLKKEASRLAPIVKEIGELGIRVSLFMDATSTEWALARELGAHRVELYTEPYAAAFARGEGTESILEFSRAAAAARTAGLGVNAGHDLNLENLGAFARNLPELLEVSIGHAFIADALDLGMAAAVQAYLRVLEEARAS